MAADNINTALLLQQLKLGSEQASAVIYDHHSRPLYRNFLTIVKDDDIAQELLQDLFLKLWIKRADLDAGKPLQPYLYKMASRLAYNHFRKVAQDQRLINQLILTTVNHVTNIEDNLIDKETQALLKQAIDHLPIQRKKVFTLCKLEGKSYDEVSELLGISNATINEHVVKANKAIKRYFWANYSVMLLLVVMHVVDH